MKSFELHPSLQIELVAAEPLVVDPVAIAFDEQGRLWVAEMADYPNGPADGQTPKSRLRLLEDRDGDGRFETSTLFADGLLFANGVQPWRGGVIATLSGEVAWLKDTDGDGKADLRETWFSGFKEENPQLRANHPTFAVDNHIYVANGLRGGDVIARRREWSDGAKPISISGMDFRFDPLRGMYEAVSGNGQFGLTFDDFGNRFVSSNRNPCKHIVLEDRDIRRNPFLAVRQVYQDVAAAGEGSRVFAISRTWTTSTLHEGQFTAACGVTIYRGNLLPDEFRGNSFTCEPTGNLVHRDVLTPRGATFSSRPGREGVEFLASKDEWFRPVNLANGPDGALYVVDMYRAVIEHPQFMPEELKNRPDLYQGNDRGRIYRIVPLSRQTAVPRAHRDPKRPMQSLLAEATSAELVALLAHPNSWQRETAQRLLIERQDKSVESALRDAVLQQQSERGRIHALWTLSGLDLLQPADLLPLLSAPERFPRLSEQALRLLAPMLQNESARKVIEAQGMAIGELLPAPSRKTDRRLMFALALAHGELPAAELQQDWLIDRLATMLLEARDDEWTRMAVLTSAAAPQQILERVFRQIEREANWDGRGVADAMFALAELVGSRQEGAADALALLAASPESDVGLRLRMAGLRGLGAGLRRRGKPFWTLVETLPDEQRRSALLLFEQVAQAAANSKLDAATRADAIELLQYASFAVSGDVLMEVARGEQNQSFRVAAIDALGGYSDGRIGRLLIDGFSAQTPALRAAILDAMLADEQRTRLLLDEIEAQRIAASELDPLRAGRLAKHRNAEIRSRAQKLLAAAVPADRQEVLAVYQAALALPADAKRGREIFKKSCVACHRVGELGVNVAPDIADSRTKTPEQLLVSILDPNRAIDNNYFSYSVLTVDGKVHTGIIAAETASSVTLRQQEGKSVTLLRQDIDELKSNGISLMPVGLEKNITTQQMADLISFVKNWRYLDGRVPLKESDQGAATK